jgi:agmatine/peptidylarginine deiminase
MNIKWESTEPDRSGYRMPAEWESHDRIWIGWPQRPDVWRNKAGPSTRAFVQVQLLRRLGIATCPIFTMLRSAADASVSCACAQVVEAVSKFEFVTVGANEEQVRLHRCGRRCCRC